MGRSRSRIGRSSPTAKKHDLMLGTHASAEAQAASLSDDIAYHSHDLDDGMRFGLFGADDLAHLPITREALAESRKLSFDMPEERPAPRNHPPRDQHAGQRPGGGNPPSPGKARPADAG